MRSKVQILDAVNQEIRVIYIRRRWSIGALGEIICASVKKEIQHFDSSEEKERGVQPLDYKERDNVVYFSNETSSL